MHEILEFSAPKAVILISVTPFTGCIKTARPLQYSKHPFQKKREVLETGLSCGEGFFVPLEKLFVFVADIFRRLEGVTDCSKNSLYHSFIFAEAEDT